MAWISVKDELPEASGQYMVYCDGSQPRCNGSGVYAPFYFSKPHNTFREDVTHWQPMPKPPRGA